MSYPRVLEDLILAYAPEGALDLPFETQRHIVREMTGYLPSDADVVAEYLSNPKLGILARDSVILPSLQRRLQEETAIFVTNPQVIEQYLNRGETEGFEILTRDPSTWDQIQQQVSSEEFADLLLQAGTREALMKNLQVTDREVHDLDDQEKRAYFLASLHQQAWDELTEFLDDVEYTLGDFNTAEHRQEILSLTPEEVKLLVEFEVEHEADDFTVFFPPAYYLEGDVERFMYYMSLLDERHRTITMSNMAHWGEMVLDLNSPVVQAYVRMYPESREVRAIREGGVEALHDINYGPRFEEPQSMSFVDFSEPMW